MAVHMTALSVDSVIVNSSSQMQDSSMFTQWQSPRLRSSCAYSADAVPRNVCYSFSVKEALKRKFANIFLQSDFANLFCENDFLLRCEDGPLLELRTLE